MGLWNDWRTRHQTWRLRLTGPFSLRLEAQANGLAILTNGGSTVLPWGDPINTAVIDVKTPSRGSLQIALTDSAGSSSRFTPVMTPATLIVSTHPSYSATTTARTIQAPNNWSVKARWIDDEEDDPDEPATTSWGWDGGFSW